MGEVIAFPGKHKDFPAQSVDDIKDQVLQNRIDHINETMKPVINGLIGMINSLGVDINIENGKNISFVVEGVRALLYKKMGMEHFMQSYIEENGKVGYDDDGDPQFYFGEKPSHLTDMNPNPPNLIA